MVRGYNPKIGVSLPNLGCHCSWATYPLCCYKFPDLLDWAVRRISVRIPWNTVLESDVRFTLSICVHLTLFAHTNTQRPHCKQQNYYSLPHAKQDSPPQSITLCSNENNAKEKLIFKKYLYKIFSWTIILNLYTTLLLILPTYTSYYK